MDHGEGDRERPVVHLLVEDVLVVDDHREAEEDPDRHVAVGEDDLFYHAVAEGASFPHCDDGGGGGGGCGGEREICFGTFVCLLSLVEIRSFKKSSGFSDTSDLSCGCYVLFIKVFINF